MPAACTRRGRPAGRRLDSIDEFRGFSILLMVLANFLANRYNKSYDSTSNKRFSLSDQGLPQHLHIRPPRPRILRIYTGRLELLPPHTKRRRLPFANRPGIHQPHPLLMPLTAHPARRTNQAAPITRHPGTGHHHYFRLIRSRRLTTHAVASSARKLNVSRPRIRASFAAASGGQASPCTGATGTSR